MQRRVLFSTLWGIPTGLLAEKMLLRHNGETMKILAVSDQVVERMYELVPQGHFAGVQMILGCGDLPYAYLEYLVTMLNVPLFYVPGNHDPAHNDRFVTAQAEGGVNLDLRTSCCNDLLLAGFGGSIRYRPYGVNQYTQSEAYLRAGWLLTRLLTNRLRYGRALDILVTHSPAYGIHDDDSSAHRGLKAINWLLRVARPRFHLHGHMHEIRRNLSPEVSQVGPTTSMNIFPYDVIEVPDAG